MSQNSNKGKKINLKWKIKKLTIKNINSSKISDIRPKIFWPFLQIKKEKINEVVLAGERMITILRI